MHKYQKKKKELTKTTTKQNCFLETEKQLGCAYKFTMVKTIYPRSASGQATFRMEKRGGH